MLLALLFIGIHFRSSAQTRHIQEATEADFGSNQISMCRTWHIYRDRLKLINE